MALSQSDQDRIIRMLEDLEREKVMPIIASLESFSKWLARAAYDIWCKVKDYLKNLFFKICDIFSIRP